MASSELTAYQVPDTDQIFYFHPEWHTWLTERKILYSASFNRMLRDLMRDNQTRPLLPEMGLWFAAFADDPRHIRVVIIGQDPYPTQEEIDGVMKNMATGYSFEVAKGFALAPSLKTIYKAIVAQKAGDQERIDFAKGDLSFWRNQGVFLFNKALTIGEKRPTRVTEDGKRVEKMLPKSYLHKWSFFNRKVVELLSDKLQAAVFMIWGAKALNLVKYIDGEKHKILKSYHPSDQGEAAGEHQTKKASVAGKSLELDQFSKANHFNCANAFLLEKERGQAIDWSTSCKNDVSQKACIDAEAP